MRYFTGGVLLTILGLYQFLGTNGLSGDVLIAAAGLFVADAITRLTKELRDQSQCDEATETLRRLGNGKT